MALILDTNAISALSAQEDALLNILEPGAELCVTVVNAAEYFYGIQNSKKKTVSRWGVGRWPAWSNAVARTFLSSCPSSLIRPANLN